MKTRKAAASAKRHAAAASATPTMRPTSRRPSVPTSAPAMRPRNTSATARWPSEEDARYPTVRPTQSSPRPEMLVTGMAMASARVLLANVPGEAAQRGEDLVVVRVVRSQLHRVLLLDRHRQLEHVERIEAQPLAEERGIGFDVLGPDALEMERFDDQARQFRLALVLIDHGSSLRNTRATASRARSGSRDRGFAPSRCSSCG